MLRYGKKHDQSYDDKLTRSNRGRARTSATAEDRKHANRGYRRGQVQISELRADKKRSRLAARFTVENEIFDLELSKSDPEIWLHGADLTTFADTVTKQHRGYPFSFASFVADPYEYAPDAFDWGWDRDEDEFRYLNGSCDDDSRDYDSLRGREPESDWGAWDSDPDPEPSDAAWRDLWVNGHAHDPEGRDLPDPMDDRWYGSYADDDYLADLYNPLLALEDPAPSATVEAASERNLERHRAGERYFRQTGRTVRKPLGVELMRSVKALSRKTA